MTVVPSATSLYATPDGLQRPLRVVLVTPPQVPGWVHAFHALASGCDWLEPVVVTTDDAVLPQVVKVPLGLRAFIAFEHAVLGVNRSLARVPMLQAAATPADAVLPLHERVAAAHPDLVILFGPEAWAESLARLAPLGCWHASGSLLDRRHAGLSLVDPMVRGETATQIALMLQAGEGAPLDLAASWGRTRATSFLKQREDAFRKLPGLLVRGLHRLAGGYLRPSSHAVATLQLPPMSSTGAIALRTLWSTVRSSPRWLTGWFRNVRVGWTLVLRLGGLPLDPESPAIGSHALLKAPKGWWGDPFVVAANGRKFVFVEEMADPRSRKANIACVELVAGGAQRLGVAIDEPGHLSFPQVFEWQGTWYMTLESGYDRRVSLYQATDFPMGWSRIADLVTGRVAVDPVLHHHEGRWYLFANVAENHNNTCDELFLFVADRLEGPYLPHPASPIVCDVRRARMAGRLFRRGGRLVRPGQDCAPGYGNAVVFNEVMELSPTAYRERALSRLAPRLARMVDGCHTYNADGGIEVLDILGRPPNGTAFLQVFDAPALPPPSNVTFSDRFGMARNAPGVTSHGAAHTGPRR
ncbi:hypothetical protein ACFPN1_02430 [Lysobacter yangpyeongensis]|uniref:Glucosamine inositolphosphorylceramide transferase 1 N-terminal domain-containing protein n=1 Tax=Lysobacter yangpyeongensis TaxID=346182 RepID=A0ABW0SJ03_9GAMM